MNPPKASNTFPLKTFCALVAGTFLLASWLPGQARGGDTAQGEDAPHSAQAAQAAMVKLIALNNEGKLLSKPALDVLAGEAKSWKVPSLGTLQPAPDKVLSLDRRHAVARVQWHGKNSHLTDYYFYLLKDKDDIWKVEACRSLSSVGIVEEARRKLLVNAKHSSEENYQLRNMSLFLSSDAQLKEWFGRNKAALDALCQAVKALPKPYPSEIKASDRQQPKIAKMIESLCLDRIALHDSGAMQAIIGGVNRDTVGLLNLSGGKRPEISQKCWIWIEPLGGNWYLFKHT